MVTIRGARERSHEDQRGPLEFKLGWWIRQLFGEDDETGHPMTPTTEANACFKREEADVPATARDYQIQAVPMSTIRACNHPKSEAVQFKLLQDILRSLTG